MLRYAVLAAQRNFIHQSKRLRGLKMRFELYPLRSSRARTTTLIMINVESLLKTIDFSVAYPITISKKVYQS